MTNRSRSRSAVAAALVSCLAIASVAPAAAQSRFLGTRATDYPTSTVIDYAVACMTANGEDQVTRDKCACSIDVIGTLLPYDAYEEAEAFLSLSRIQGERGALFSQSEASHAAVDRLRRAQIESELRCF